ncbi:Diguanylate Cyclase and Two-component system sensory domain-containing protein [Halogranum gelatinilyticum]|uniref:Diguanylate Cyclase and Two-component system sensory domain-containing protein n=1 Tax=Halogranum gelatinilyticum TaxID=660521 RepID=A0A1G9TEZ3_9EURY|nr:DICT sensory domain-containing protein [Halogranum gelatinilyticum]SDM46240.1 Diguanylate Cyclase and Two-component system sensory domain-containing protein [Halogranum gelatinilyticum]
MRALYDHLVDHRRTLAVHNPDRSVDLEPIRSLLSAHGIQLSVVETAAATPPGFCVLYDDEGVLATTTLAELDQYTELEASLAGDTVPSVLSAVDPETTILFEESIPKLASISRELEAIAWRDGGGRLVVGFQELSTFRKQSRTQEVYDELVRAGLDVTVCGYPDVTVDDSLVSIYEDHEKQFADYWFVLFDGSERKGALIARETEPDTFTGLWTRNGPVVEELFAMLESRYPELLED